MKYQNIHQAALDFIQGWDNWDSAVDTAENGLPLDKLEQLKAAYGEADTARIADEIKAICREMVEI